MAETLITSDECAWSQVSIQLLGRKLTKLRGFSVKESTEKEPIYGSGDDPVDIVSGNNKYEGSLKLLKSEFDLLTDAAQQAGYASLLRVPHSLVFLDMQYKKSETSPIRIQSCFGVAFTEIDTAMEQGAKFTEITLPFICMKIVNIKK